MGIFFAPSAAPESEGNATAVAASAPSRNAWRREVRVVIGISSNTSYFAADARVERKIEYSAADMTTAVPTIREGLVHHRAGRLAEAEEVYRHVLSCQPDNADALHLLGVVLFRNSRQEEALELIARAVALKPGMAEFHSNLAMVFGALGRLDECVQACREAARLLPQSSTILCNLGSALQLAGRLDEA